MMRHALTHNFAETVIAGGGLLLRLRAWFARGAAGHAAALCDKATVHAALHDVMTSGADDMSRNDAGPASAAPRNVAQVSTQDGATRTAVLLPFPVRGEALLVKLAELLRGRVAGHASWHESFLLTMSRAPRSRLTIDRASYVEFDPRRATYHVVVEAAPETTVMLDTTDFDALVQFVAQYVTDRLSDTGTAEAAS